MDLSGRCSPPTASVVWSLDGIWAWKSSSGLIDSTGHQARALEAQFGVDLNGDGTVLSDRGGTAGAAYLQIDGFDLMPPAISLTASQSDVLLQAMAIQKASLFSTLLSHWVSWTGEPLAPGASLQVTVSPLTPPIQPQVKEWIELFDKGVISREELRHQLALATANAISSPTLDDSPTVSAEERAEQRAARQRAAGRQAGEHGGVLTPGGATPDAPTGSAP